MRIVAADSTHEAENSGALTAVPVIIVFSLRHHPPHNDQPHPYQKHHGKHIDEDVHQRTGLISGFVPLKEIEEKYQNKGDDYP